MLVIEHLSLGKVLRPSPTCNRFAHVQDLSYFILEYFFVSVFVHLFLGLLEKLMMF